MWRHRPRNGHLLDLPPHHPHHLGDHHAPCPPPRQPICQPRDREVEPESLQVLSLGGHCARDSRYHLAAAFPRCLSLVGVFCQQGRVPPHLPVQWVIIWVL